MGAKHWTDWFPVQETLLNEAKQDTEAPLMVDVGAGRGHDLVVFHKNFPKAPGKLILQELQHVVDEVNIPYVENMTHDFFTPQPIPGKSFTRIQQTAGWLTTTQVHGFISYITISIIGTMTNA